ncbi:MAG: HicB family [Pseudomonadota bacterium]|jgi:predicted HicB family RNase H-like nuclease
MVHLTRPRTRKPYFGTLSLRLPPELHRKVAAAALAGKSVNRFIAETLEAVAF